MYKLQVDDKTAWLRAQGRISYQDNVSGDKIRCCIETRERFLFGRYQDDDELAVDSLIDVIHYFLYTECKTLWIQIAN